MASFYFFIIFRMYDAQKCIFVRSCTRTSNVLVDHLEFERGWERALLMHCLCILKFSCVLHRVCHREVMKRTKTKNLTSFLSCCRCCCLQNAIYIIKGLTQFFFSCKPRAGLTLHYVITCPLNILRLSTKMHQYITIMMAFSSYYKKKN